MNFREDRARGANRENNEPEAKQTTAYFEAAAELTESRASWLRGRIRNEADSLTGLWIYSFGGTLEPVQEETRLLFTIEVVRGPTFHFGSIAGVTAWNTPLGWFTDKGRHQEKTDESKLVFVERGAALEIIGANTAYYHGAALTSTANIAGSATLDENKRLT
jgi:hypothetical protein